ncbi:MAG: glycosyltransferase family 4 protein [Burkholderiales bacterium]|nr:glycosyltransferase family 4 protein [Burkholderiales bacterium]
MLRYQARLALDHPNARSLHLRPVPRTGGIAVMLGVLLAGFMLVPQSRLLLLGAAVLSAVSFFDDWRGMPAAVRLLIHSAVAAAAALLLVSDMPSPRLAIVIAATIWMTNLYNFMDGSDGLAGGMALFGFGSLAFAASSGGALPLALIAACVAASAAAFLVFNFSPARIFLGDAGSIPLGFLAAMLGVSGWQQQLWQPWYPLLVFSPFIVDASATLAKRALRCEKVWQAHRDHYYQRLILMGLGHRNTALGAYALMLASGCSGVWARTQSEPTQHLVLLVWALLYALIFVLIDLQWNRHLLASRSNAPGES